MKYTIQNYKIKDIMYLMMYNMYIYIYMKTKNIWNICIYCKHKHILCIYYTTQMCVYIYIYMDVYIDKYQKDKQTYIYYCSVSIQHIYIYIYVYYHTYTAS